MKLLTFFFMLLFVASMVAAQTITYTLGMSQPSTHLFEVEASFSGISKGQTIDLLMPVWRSGRYIIYDFAGDVQEFSASDGKGTSLSWEKTDKMTWRIRTGGATSVVAKYKVYANEINQRTKELSDQGAYLDGSAIFMYADAYRKISPTLVINPFRDWHVTSGLSAAKGKTNTFTAPTYEYLIDCPIFVGNQIDIDFEAGGKPHVLSIQGEGNFDTKQLVEDISKLVEVNKQFWGSLPYERYAFMMQVSPQHGGGTEHINSTIMGTRPWGFNTENGRRGFLGLVSHEYFHTWNVKQIRPHGISPYDWTKENYTRELWIAEGITSYYGGLLMIRAGFGSGQKYVEQLPGQIQGDRQRPGNLIQSATESSFDAWIKYWKGRQQSYNAESDYYDRGSDLGLFLDLEIRNRSKNKASLDDVMRSLYKRYPWNSNGYTVEDFRKLCEEFGGSSFKQFFDDHVYGTKPLPWEKALSYAGLEVREKDEKKVWFGAFVFGDRPRIGRLVAGSPAANAGLDFNDEVIALNRYRVSASDFNTRVGEMKDGDKANVTVIRGEMLREFEVTIKNNPIPSYSVTKAKEPTDLQKSMYESWLSAKWDEEKTKEGK